MVRFDCCCGTSIKRRGLGHVNHRSLLISVCAFNPPPPPSISLLACPDFISRLHIIYIMFLFSCLFFFSLSLLVFFPRSVLTNATLIFFFVFLRACGSSAGASRMRPLSKRGRKERRNETPDGKTIPRTFSTGPADVLDWQVTTCSAGNMPAESGGGGGGSGGSSF